VRRQAVDDLAQARGIAADRPDRRGVLERHDRGLKRMRSAKVTLRTTTTMAGKATTATSR
jgi:hypothetical protein